MDLLWRCVHLVCTWARCISHVRMFYPHVLHQCKQVMSCVANFSGWIDTTRLRKGKWIDRWSIEEPWWIWLHIQWVEGIFLVDFGSTGFLIRSLQEQKSSSPRTVLFVLIDGSQQPAADYVVVNMDGQGISYLLPQYITNCSQLMLLLIHSFRLDRLMRRENSSIGKQYQCPWPLLFQKWNFRDLSHARIFHIF